MPALRSMRRWTRKTARRWPLVGLIVLLVLVVVGYLVAGWPR